MIRLAPSQCCQLNDLLVKIYKKPYTLETVILTSVLCIVNIKKV